MNEIFHQAAEQLLIWIGFGTLVGLLAKAIFPGKDPGGAFATLVIGVLGSVIGAGTLAYFSDSLRVTPISPIGFVVAIGGTMMLLFTHRLLHGTGLWNRFALGGATTKRPQHRVTITERP